MGETRVDIQHLLEDLRDAYTGSLEETIVSEIVANSLDSGAKTIDLVSDPSESVFRVLDDGSGMQRRELARYHDLASSSKSRGEGIGFAGVGIKLGLLVSEETTTESRRGKAHVATKWHLSSRHRAPWKWIPPPGAVANHGTSVTLRLRNALSPLADPSFIEASVRRHYMPLLDPRFTAFLAPRYGAGVRFRVNGSVLEPEPTVSVETVPIEVKLGRKRKPSAIGFLSRHAASIPEDRRGLAISTLGKVIRRGWDWLGVSPAKPDLVSGIIEAPDLASTLTLSKADFIRAGSRGAAYLAFRRAIQQAVASQLDAWGDMRASEPDTRRRVARPIEKDLERVLVDLADEFPLLAALVERRAGGQRSLPIGGRGAESGRAALATSLIGAAGALGGAESEAAVALAEEPPGSPAPDDAAKADGSEPEHAHLEGSAALPGATGRAKRPQTYGLRIAFEPRPDDPAFARLVETTIWVNESHPAYRRAIASRSEGYHVALSAAMALAPLATDAQHGREFVADFMARWGEGLKT